MIILETVLNLLIAPAYAAEGAAGDSSGLGQLVPLVILFVLMYFLLIRPQQKRAKEHKALLLALKKGDEVVTNGGVLGVVVSVDESFAQLTIAEGVTVKVQKQGINQKMPKGSARI